MITTSVYDTTGKVIGKVNLPKIVFGAQISPVLMTQAVRVYLSNQRKAHPKAKTRGEVDLTKAKWFRQKGTGRARHGARSAPIFVGGGVAHGPRGNQNWKKTLPEKMKKQALVSALTSKFKDDQVVIINGLEKIGGKTKEMAKIIEAFLNKKATRKALLVLPKSAEKIVRAGRNIPGLIIRPVSVLNTYEILNGGTIFFTKDSLAEFEKIFKK